MERTLRKEKTTLELELAQKKAEVVDLKMQLVKLGKAKESQLADTVEHEAGASEEWAKERAELCSQVETQKAEIGKLQAELVALQTQQAELAQRKLEEVAPAGEGPLPDSKAPAAPGKGPVGGKVPPGKGPMGGKVPPGKGSLAQGKLGAEEGGTKAEAEAVKPELEAIFDDIDAERSGFATRLDLRSAVMKLKTKCPAISALSDVIKKQESALVDRDTYLKLVEEWVESR